MDFTETKAWLEKAMHRRGVDDLTFGGVEVFKDFQGRLVIQTGGEKYKMDGRVPAEIFDKLHAGIEIYSDLDADTPPERTDAEQAAYDLLSE